MTFESSTEIELPTNKEGVYILIKDNVTHKGNSGEKSIIAYFRIPFRSYTFFKYPDYSVLIQFMRKSIFVKFNFADLVQVKQWLETTLNISLKLKSFFLYRSLMRSHGSCRLVLGLFVAEIEFELKNGGSGEYLSLGEIEWQELMTIVTLNELQMSYTADIIKIGD